MREDAEFYVTLRHAIRSGYRDKSAGDSGGNGSRDLGGGDDGKTRGGAVEALDEIALASSELDRTECDPHSCTSGALSDFRYSTMAKRSSGESAGPTTPFPLGPSLNSWP